MRGGAESLRGPCDQVASRVSPASRMSVKDHRSGAEAVSVASDGCVVERALDIFIFSKVLGVGRRRHRVSCGKVEAGGDCEIPEFRE